MKEEMEVWEEPDESGISVKEWQHLYAGVLSVALKLTLPGDVEIKASGELNFPQLINPPLEIHLTKEEKRRVAHPAVGDGDISKKDKGEVKFLSWVNWVVPTPEREKELEKLNLPKQQLVLRLRNKYRWVKFARFGEKDTFGFNPRLKEFFVSLACFDWEDEFVPVYGKILEGTAFVYFEISAEAGEEAITLKIRRVSEAEVPPHLAQAKP